MLCYLISLIVGVMALLNFFLGGFVLLKLMFIDDEYRISVLNFLYEFIQDWYMPLVMYVVRVAFAFFYKLGLVSGHINISESEDIQIPFIYELELVSRHINISGSEDIQIIQIQIILWVTLFLCLLALGCVLLIVFFNVLANFYAKKWNVFLIWADKVNKVISQQSSMWIGGKLFRMLIMFISKKGKKQKFKDFKFKEESKQTVIDTSKTTKIEIKSKSWVTKKPMRHQRSWRENIMDELGLEEEYDAKDLLRK